MGWDAILFAELTFPPGGIEAWRDLEMEESTYEDWSDVPLMAGVTDTTTVAAVIAKLEEHSRWCAEVYRGPDHQRLVIDGDGVSFRAYINEDDYGSYSGDIATLFRLGERVGAKGEYVVLANDCMSGDRIVLAGGKSRLEQVDFVEMLSGGAPPEGDLDYQGILDDILDVTQKKVDAMVAAQAAKPEPAMAKAKAKPEKSKVSKDAKTATTKTKTSAAKATTPTAKAKAKSEAKPKVAPSRKRTP